MASEQLRVLIDTSDREGLLASVVVSLYQRADAALRTDLECLLRSYVQHVPAFTERLRLVLSSTSTSATSGYGMQAHATAPIAFLLLVLWRCADDVLRPEVEQLIARQQQRIAGFVNDLRDAADIFEGFQRLDQHIRPHQLIFNTTRSKVR